MNRRQTLQRLAPLAGLALLGASMGLSGCTGWRVRQRAVGSFRFSKLYIKDDLSKTDTQETSKAWLNRALGRPSLRDKLALALQTRQTVLVLPSRQDAEVILTLNSMSLTESAVGFTGGGQLREVEIRGTVSYSIEDALGSILSELNRIETRRSVIRSETTYLAGIRESSDQIDQIESYFIQRIIDHLASIENAPIPRLP